MLKYCGYYITFQEVPHEVSLTFSITNCPFRCKGCHSPWLQADLGYELTLTEFITRIDQYKDAITCICFMGTGKDILALLNLIHEAHILGYKVCVYTGREDNMWDTLYGFKEYNIFIPDYVKYGSYKEDLGGLASPTTNQRMIKKTSNGWEDITSVFWKKKE